MHALWWNVAEHGGIKQSTKGRAEEVVPGPGLCAALGAAEGALGAHVRPQLTSIPAIAVGQHTRIYTRHQLARGPLKFHIEPRLNFSARL
jgi:hypothetical protein